MIRPIIFGALLWVTCYYALRRGGRDERIAAIGMFLNSYLTVLVITPLAHRFTHVEMPVVYVDLALIVLLMWVAMRSDRFWPMWLVAMQTLGTLAHFAPFVPHIIPWGYATAMAMWMYLMLITLFVATRRAHLEQKRAAQPLPPVR